MTRILILTLLIGCCFGCCISTCVAQVVDFSDLTLTPNSYWSGPDPEGEIIEGEYGPEVAGEFASRGVAFANIFDQTYGSWRSFAYSNTSDTTTPGVANQYSAITGSGRGGAGDNYAVAFGYHDLAANLIEDEPFDPLNAAHLTSLPTFELPFGRSLQSVWITNTTYAALSMRDGDGFSKAFGGDSGTDPDWLRVSAYGTDDAGVPLGVTVDFYLADYRFANSADDFIVSAWTQWDLSALAAAREVHFNIASSDAGQFGLNTPPYFALDDLLLNVGVLPGDFNGDATVDAADYTVWRDTVGVNVDRRGSGADGDLSGVIDAGDLAVWRANFGATSAGAAVGVVPEPQSLGMLLLVSYSWFLHRKKVS